MKQMLCPYCLSPLEGEKDHCPFCRKTFENINPEGALVFASILAEKYTVGRFLGTDGEGITYEAVNNVTGPFCGDGLPSGPCALQSGCSHGSQNHVGACPQRYGY